MSQFQKWDGVLATEAYIEYLVRIMLAEIEAMLDLESRLA